MHLKIPKPGLTDSLSWFEDDVTAVEHQQANDDEYNDPQSETGLKGQRQHWLFSFQFHPVSNNSRARMFKLQRLQKPATLDIPGFAPSKSETWEELSAAPVWCPKVCWGWTCPSSCSIWRSYDGRASRETIRTGRWIQNRGGYDQEGPAQHSHGDDAGVFGGVTTAGDFESRSKRTVNVDFLWRGDDVVGRTLKRAARKESMMTSITDGMNTSACLSVSFSNHPKQSNKSRLILHISVVLQPSLLHRPCGRELTSSLSEEPVNLP